MKKKKKSVAFCNWIWFDPWVRKIPWRTEWLPTAVFWPGEFHGQRSLAGYSPWGCKESDTTERLTFTVHLRACLTFSTLALHLKILIDQCNYIHNASYPPVRIFSVTKHGQIPS